MHAHRRAVHHAGVQPQPEVGVLLHRADALGVEELQRGGSPAWLTCAVVVSLLAAIGFVQADNASDGMEAIRRLFSPEFRNRLDAIIQFNGLDPRTIQRVVDKLFSLGGFRGEEEDSPVRLARRFREIESSSLGCRYTYRSPL